MENCHHDHIPFNVKGNGNIVFSVYSVGWLLVMNLDTTEHEHTSIDIFAREWFTEYGKRSFVYLFRLFDVSFAENCHFTQDKFFYSAFSF